MCEYRPLVARSLIGSSPVIGFALVWEALAMSLGHQRFPGLGHTLALFLQSATHDPIILAQGGGGHGFLPHVLSTLAYTCIGCGMGVVIGLLLALTMSQCRPTLWMCDSLLEIARILPPLMFVPVAILILGSSQIVEIVSVALYSGLSMGMYALNSISNISPDLLALGGLLGAGRTRLLLTVKLPAVLPDLVGPLRVIVTLGLGIAVVSEFLAAPMGIGRVMKFALSYSRADLIMVGAVWAVLLVALLDTAITVAGRGIFRWTTRNPLLREDTIG